MNRYLLQICLVCLLFISHMPTSSAQWQETNGPFGGYICSVAHDGTNLYAGTNISGLYSSADNGANWSLNYYTSFYFRMNALLVDGGNLFAATNNGIILSTDNGGSWTSVNNGLTYLTVYAMAISGTNLFAGTPGGGVFLSTNNGANWTPVNNGLTNMDVRCLAASGTSIFAGTMGGEYFCLQIMVRPGIRPTMG